MRTKEELQAEILKFTGEMDKLNKAITKMPPGDIRQSMVSKFDKYTMHLSNLKDELERSYPGSCDYGFTEMCIRGCGCALCPSVPLNSIVRW